MDFQHSCKNIYSDKFKIVEVCSFFSEYSSSLKRKHSYEK